MKYCSNCGDSLVRRIPEGDDHMRFACDGCGTIHYQNPTMVVGTIPRWEERILLCRRAIEPMRGLWTLPAGYLELGETVSAGARRETLEEAGAVLGELSPFALFDLPFFGMVYFMFVAEMTTPEFLAGQESLETRLFTEEEIPWGEIAFGVIEETLRRYFSDRKKGRFEFHMGEILKGAEIN